MNRRGFLSLLAGAAAFTLDPERALWVPGRKLISIPATLCPRAHPCHLHGTACGMCQACSSPVPQLYRKMESADWRIMVNDDMRAAFDNDKLMREFQVNYRRMNPAGSVTRRVSVS